MTVDGPLIDFRNVMMAFGGHVVHRDISLSVAHGENVTILGPSGGGKTVILRLIAGFLFATKGVVAVMGRDMDSLSEDELRAIRHKIGFLFQGAALFDSLNVFENVAYSLREHGERDQGTISSIVNEKLELVGLPEIAHKFPSQLSGGQKKRVGLARALASSPEIMLFDEPTTGLDPTAVRLIDELIVRLRDQYKITSIVVTHDIQSAQKISDRWILIGNGYKIADGRPDELTKSHDKVRRFITGYSTAEELDEGIV